MKKTSLMSILWVPLKLSYATNRLVRKQSASLIFTRYIYAFSTLCAIGTISNVQFYLIENIVHLFHLARLY